MKIPFQNKLNTSSMIFTKYSDVQSKALPPTTKHTWVLYIFSQPLSRENEKFCCEFIMILF